MLSARRIAIHGLKVACVYGWARWHACDGLRDKTRLLVLVCGVESPKRPLMADVHLGRGVSSCGPMNLSRGRGAVVIAQVESVILKRQSPNLPGDDVT